MANPAAQSRITDNHYQELMGQSKGKFNLPAKKKLVFKECNFEVRNNTENTVPFYFTMDRVKNIWLLHAPNVNAQQVVHVDHILALPERQWVAFNPPPENHPLKGLIPFILATSRKPQGMETIIC